MNFDVFNGSDKVLCYVLYKFVVISYSFHDTQIVLIAVAITAAVCLSLTIFALQTRVSVFVLLQFSCTLQVPYTCRMNEFLCSNV